MTGISICGTDCQALQVMDMKVYTGEISPHLKPNTKVSLSFFFFPLNTLIITLLMWSQRKSTYCTSLHPEMIVSPLPVRISCLWPCYSRDRQPPAGFLPWSTAGQAALIPLHTPPISVPPTIPDGTDSPERNRKEGEVRRKITFVNTMLAKSNDRVVLVDPGAK